MQRESVDHMTTSQETQQGPHQGHEGEVPDRKIASTVSSLSKWPSHFEAKQCTAAEAIAAIEPGQRILIGSGAAEPIALVEALVDAGSHLRNNEIVHLLTIGPAPYVVPELSERFRHTAFFIGENVRAAVQEGRADFMPVFLSEIPILMRTGRIPIDVALVQVSPPDRLPL